MRKVLSVILYTIAGFFVYMVCLLSFINQPPAQKWGIVAGFFVPALLFLCIGLALNRFQNWKRHTGIVLLSGAGLTGFIIFTFACLLMTDEFKRMMQPDTLDFFSAYILGSIFTLATGILGVLFITIKKKSS